MKIKKQDNEIAYWVEIPSVYNSSGIEYICNKCGNKKQTGYFPPICPNCGKKIMHRWGIYE